MIFIVMSMKNEDKSGWKELGSHIRMMRKAGRGKLNKHRAAGRTRGFELANLAFLFFW